MSSFKVFYEFHKCRNIATVTMINCLKIRFSLFGSRRDDSKTEKTVIWHLLIMVEKQDRKNKPNRILNNTVRVL